MIYKFGSNFLHRDLKPKNILYVDQNYKICDFGQSRCSIGQPTKERGTQEF